MSQKGGKFLASFLLVMVTLSLLTSLVGAQTNFNNNPNPTGNTQFSQGVATAWDYVIDFLNVILSPLLGNSAYQGRTEGEVLLMRALMFAIIISVLMVILGRIPVFEENAWANTVVSIAGSILVVRFMLTPVWIETIFLPYHALGIFLATFLPLIATFYFLNMVTGAGTSNDHVTWRKMGWILVGVIFVVLFFTRKDEIAQLLGTGGFNPAYIYLIAGGLSFAFLVFDRTIQRAFLNNEIRNQGVANRGELRTMLINKMQQADSDQANGRITPVQHKKIMKDLAKRLATLTRS
jgi:hypothetical protein